MKYLLLLQSLDETVGRQTENITSHISLQTVTPEFTAAAPEATETTDEPPAATPTASSGRTTPIPIHPLTANGDISTAT